MFEKIYRIKRVESGSENIITQAQIEDVYRQILQQAQGGSPCEINLAK